LRAAQAVADLYGEHACDRKVFLPNLEFPDAIAYYRIAATAYWRSGSPEVVNALKVKEFHAEFPGHTPPLGVTLDEARGLRRLEKDIPPFCQYI